MLREYGRIIAAILFLACNALSAWGGYSWSDNGWKLKWAERDNAEQAARIAATEVAFKKQQNLLRELDNAYKTAKDLQDQIDADRDAADDASRRLRAEIDRIRASTTSGNSATLRERAAAATNARVLSELLGQSDALAGAYAESADRNRAAVINCNAEYNAVRAAMNGSVQ